MFTLFCNDVQEKEQLVEFEELSKKSPFLGGICQLTSLKVSST